ncbi:MAG: hypothetical protein KBG20_03745 [Caldilineaceae bacterium]|nr:hypothetical protein [Caldilineaceae bacterium]MBP8106562.1 hypothetical protein [Caldilineaceae bacterium]MBP8121584.1 hypothetical protein [Caldilineaceae bacterium]MBP9071381.1 hypothetical protein [Caldilineaceae bacterium]
MILRVVRTKANGCLLTAMGWLRSSGGDLVWSSLLVIAVLLPLASLTIDVPRYLILRTRLSLAADAVAAGTARCVDVSHFQNTGESRLNPFCVDRTSRDLFAEATTGLTANGFSPSLTGVAIDETADTITVSASGTTRLFFQTTPNVTVNVDSRSRFRMDVR